MPEKKKALRGFAAHPENINRGGKNRGPNKSTQNKKLKEEIKAVSKEALDNIIAVMRFNKDRVGEGLQDYLDKRIANEGLKKADLSTEELIALKTEEDDLLNQLTKWNDHTARYSIKVLDYAYNLVLHDEKIAISKKKIDPSEEDEEEEAPEVSTSAV